MFSFKFYAALPPLVSLLPTTLAVPSRAYCRCVTFNPEEPWTFSPALLAASQRTDVCSRLGPGLEHWRHLDPAAYEAYFDELVGENVWYPPPADELKPLPTGVLMEISMPRLNYRYEGPPASAPTTPPTIVCRSESPKQVAERDSDLSLFYIAVILLVVCLACVAEVINIVIARYVKLSLGPQRRLTSIRVHKFYKAKAPVRLPGGEKVLQAWSSPDSSTTDGLDCDADSIPC
jgi:hypothetical protein